MRKLAMAALLLLFAIPVLADDSLGGKWTGLIEINYSSSAALIVVFEEVDGVLKGKATIHAGIMYREPIDITIDGAKVMFEAKKVAGNPTWNGTLNRGKITGDYRHLGQSMRFYLTRAKE